MTVKLRESKRLGSRLHEKRRGHRMNSRVPVRLEWDDESGTRVSIEAHTRVVNPYGCMVVLAQSLNLEHRLALNNLATDASNAAIIVWKGNQRPDGWEYGVELVAPEMVSATGGMIILPEGFAQGTKFTLENPKTQQRVEVNVVRSPQMNQEGSLFPVEFLTPAPQFWNIFFPPNIN